MRPGKSYANGPGLRACASCERREQPRPIFAVWWDCRSSTDKLKRLRDSPSPAMAFFGSDGVKGKHGDKTALTEHVAAGQKTAVEETCANFRGEDPAQARCGKGRTRHGRSGAPGIRPSRAYPAHRNSRHH